ncbi:transposable element Tc1 transposase [Trichonephila clavipes]|nr:transposable element Tc1 transposase [Trichonephila clavipes]
MKSKDVSEDAPDISRIFTLTVNLCIARRLEVRIQGVISFNSQLSLVVICHKHNTAVTDSLLACPEIEPIAAENLPCRRGRCMLNLLRLKRPPVSVVWNDESRFQLCPDDHRRCPGQLADPAFTIACHTGLQPGVMVWGAIYFNRQTRLVIIRGTLTAQRCVNDIQRTVLLPFF